MSPWKIDLRLGDQVEVVREYIPSDVGDDLRGLTIGIPGIPDG